MISLKSLLQLAFPLFLFAQGTHAFVYSCEEVQYKLMNTAFSQNTTAVCVVTQEGFTNWDQLMKISVQTSRISASLYSLGVDGYGCVSNGLTDDAWKIVADSGLTLNCAQEFSVIFASGVQDIAAPVKNVRSLTVSGSNVISQRLFTVPQTRMWLHIKSCTGNGNVIVSTGAGSGESEQCYALRTWPCALVPNWIFSFDNVVTVYADPFVSYTVEYSSDLGDAFNFPTIVSKNDQIAVLTSGRSDNLQNEDGRTNNRAYIQIENEEVNDVTVNMDLTFDSSNSGYVVLQESFMGPEQNRYYNNTYTRKFTSYYFEVRYIPSALKPSAIGKSNDNILIDISIGPNAATTTKATPTTTTTATPTTTTTTSKTPITDPYCNCAVDKFGFPSGWNYNDIWLDVVVILDTSEAMGNEALDDAGVLIESFIGDDDADFLITETTAPFYTRIGVISMADTATVLYNLNMTKADKIQGKATIAKGVLEIDVLAAYEAAINMFNNGLITHPDRANARQVIYYMSDSDPKTNLNSLNQFKASKGVIIVNNFLQQGEVELPGLKELASDGYYYANENYMVALQSFCKANCFCMPDKNELGGADPATRAAGGCYHLAPAGVPFSKAKAACGNEGGILAVIHDDKKGQFLLQQMSKATSDYFWFGYSKSDDGIWRWEDQSTDSYTNWDVDEPSPASVAKCGYVDSTTSKLAWGAGNCQLGFPYVCQYAPCSVGDNKC